MSDTLVTPEFIKSELDGVAQKLEKSAVEKIEAVKKEAEENIDKANKEITGLKEKNAQLETEITQIDVKIKEAKRPITQEHITLEQRLKSALEEETDNIEKFMRKEIKSFKLELKAVGDMSTGNVTGGSRYGQIMAPGIIYNPNRKIHMDQILPGGSIGPGNTYTFMRENGNGEGAIAPVSEGATKPQLDLDLLESTVNIETIAGWVRFTRKVMNNVPGFISFLMNRLPEKFRRVLDSQVLYGDGTTPDLKGILTAGNFVASTATSSDVLIEKLITDIAVLEDTYERDANGILLRPIDYYGFFKNKAAGSGEYDLPMGVTFEGGQLRVLGVPTWASTAINAPDYVVGDFQNGAQLLTQEAMHIEFFEQDGTNVRENKVTARIEGNYALPVYGPDYFIKGSTTQTT